MINIKTFTDSKYDGNCYLLTNNNQAIVIDPAVSKQSLNLIKDIKIKAIFITHAHFDHFSALDTYLDDDVIIYLHPQAYEKLGNPLKNLSFYCPPRVAVKVAADHVSFVNDAEELSLICWKIKIMHTIGHSNCSLSIIINDIIFTGDTLFKESVGRTDLPTSSSKELSKSLQKLCLLAGNYTIYPGHGEPTTLEDERENNPYIKGENHV